MPAALVLATGRSDVEHRGEAVIDSLTGMLNRKALQNRVEELRQQARVSDAPVGLVVIDIDHFKLVNDTVGHASGDRVLCELASIVRSELRAFEAAYRIGGEEFLVLLPGATVEQALGMAERVREAVAEATFVEELTLTISAGIAAGRASGTLDFESLFSSADAALYEAKRAGRNRVQAFGTMPAAAIAVRGPLLRTDGDPVLSGR